MCLRKRLASAANDCQDQKGTGEGRGSTGRIRIKTGEWREGEKRQKGWEGEGQRQGIWRLLGWSQKAILHRQFPTSSLCVPGGVGGHQLSSRSEPIRTLQQKWTHLDIVCGMVGKWKEGEEQERS